MSDVPVSDGHVLELLPAYALGSLDEVETKLVATHLSSCPLCQNELNAFQDVVAQLATPLPSLTPPPTLKHQLLQRVETPQPQSYAPQRQQARRPQRTHSALLSRLQPVWGYASLLLILALTATTLLFWQRANQAAVLVEQHGMRAIALNNSNSDLAPEASGFVIVGADGRNGALVVDQFPQLNPDQTYQVWLIRDGQYTSSALFTVDETGYRGARIEAPESLLTYSSVEITIEPAEGSTHPTGEQLLEGSLHNQ